MAISVTSTVSYKVKINMKFCGKREEFLDYVERVFHEVSLEHAIAEDTITFDGNQVVFFTRCGRRAAAFENLIRDNPFEGLL